MINKVYDKIKEFLKETYKIIIIYIVLLFILCFPLPFYINSPGGLIDVSKRIKISSSYPVNGSINLAYVSEIKASVTTYIIALINKEWDIIKKEAVIAPNETKKEAAFRNHILLEEANQDAIITAYTKANKSITVNDYKLYVNYILDIAKTNLKIGDQIVSIDGIKVTNKQSLLTLLKKYNVNDNLNIEVISNNKTIIRKATIIDYLEKSLIGFSVSEIKNVKTKDTIEFNFDKSESGPSGGLMMSLAIYNYITPYDITNGKKIVGTGTIDSLGNIGSIGGVTYKLKSAVKEKAKLFLVPLENLDEALELKEKKEYDIEIKGVSNFDEAINILKANKY